MQLTAEEWVAIEREYCARSLTGFIRRAWPVIEPMSRYVHGWHIDALAKHLEAITAGEITRSACSGRPGNGDRAGDRRPATSARRMPRTWRCGTICACADW